jgi:uncharacterized membrane protein YkvI
MAERQRGFFEGPYGRYLLPGVVLQSVLIGGGYATGREIVEFGAKYGALGWVAGLTIFAGFAIMAFLTFEVARRFRAFDYRSLLKQLIGPLYLLYDVVYILLAVLIIAIMAAATGEILSSTLGLNYWAGVVLIIAVVGVLNFYGEGLIERFKTIGTALLYLGYITFGLLVITRHWDEIGATLSSGDHSLHPEVGLGTVLWTGVLYVGYNLAVYPAALFTVRRQTRLRETFWAGLLSGVLMTLPWFLTYFALMGFYPREDVFGAPVPWLEMLSGYGGWVLVVFGVVVGWTLIETATGMIYALVARVDQNLVDAGRQPMSRRASGIIAVVALLLALALAQIGIIDLIAKGYTAMGYAMIAVFALPLLVRGTYLIVTGKGLRLGEPGDPTAQERT